MSLDRAQTDEPVTGIDELVRTFHAAERPATQHKVGLEHEKFIYPRGGSEPVPYDGEAGIEALLKGLTAQGYTPFREAPELPVIALLNGDSTVSLEPGGQLELSGSPFRTAREAHQENLA